LGIVEERIDRKSIKMDNISFDTPYLPEGTPAKYNG
jgi:hypothetical protein